MNLFKHWSWSRMFQQTWSVSACTYGARFQTFCERRLGLRLGVVWGDENATDEQAILYKPDVAESAGRLNYLECLLVNRMKQNSAFASSMEYVMPLEVHVLHPREAHRRRFDVKPGKPDSDDIKKTLLSFTVGFAVLFRNPETGEWELVFMRIRDHLRNLGLGRQALRYLRDELGVRELIKPDEEIGMQTLKEVWPEAKWDQFCAIFESVMREQS
jgi:hypothetical protein